jgi:hypothetical protein
MIRSLTLDRGAGNACRCCCTNCTFDTHSSGPSCGDRRGRHRWPCVIARRSDCATCCVSEPQGRLRRSGEHFEGMTLPVAPHPALPCASAFRVASRSMVVAAVDVRPGDAPTAPQQRQDPPPLRSCPVFRNCRAISPRRMPMLVRVTLTLHSLSRKDGVIVRK